MEIYIYITYSDWCNDTPSEILDGTVNFLRNGIVSIDTLCDHKPFRQILSLDKIFAIVYKLPSGFLTYSKEINIYENFNSWVTSNPEESLEGYICEDECSDKHISFITTDGYKQIISLSSIFSITYER